MYKLLRKLSYLVTPIMVVLISWTTAIKDIKLEYFLWLLISSFMLFVITVYINLHNDKDNKLSSWTGVKTIFKSITFSKISSIIIYFVLIVSIGVLLNNISSWVGNRFSHQWSLDTINNTLIVCSLFFLGLHYMLKREVWNYKYNLILTSIALMLITFDLFSNNHLDEYLVIHQFIGFILVTYYSIYLFYQILRVLVKPYNSINEDDEFPQKKHLIIFLSSINDDFRKGWNKLPEKIDFKSQTLTKIIEYINKSFTRHPWEMTLIAIEHHIKTNNKSGKLKQLTIIASSNKGYDGPPSIEQVKYFIEILKTYLDYHNLKVDIKIAKKDSNSVRLVDTKNININNFYKSCFGINFGSVEETNEAMKQILENKTTNKFTHSETVIDITSGQKSSTVAGILAATSLDVCNQYVDTNDTSKVKGYNFMYQDPTKTL